MKVARPSTLATKLASTWGRSAGARPANSQPGHELLDLDVARLGKELSEAHRRDSFSRLPANRLGCRPMNFKDLDRGELVAIVGGILLGVSLFLNWYSLGNRHATLASCHGPQPTCTGWAALHDPALRAAGRRRRAAHPRLHHRPRPRAVLAARRADRGHRADRADAHRSSSASIDQPGSPPGEISVDAPAGSSRLVADLLILAGAVWRSQESGARRKPPGVL